MFDFKFEKHNWYFPFSFLTTYTVPCLFLEGVQKRNSYLSVSTFTSKNISRKFFVVCLSLNMFLLPLSVFLTRKCINHTYLVSSYSLNTISKPYFIFYTRQQCEIYLSWCSFAFKISIVRLFLIRNL